MGEGELSVLNGCGAGGLNGCGARELAEEGNVGGCEPFRGAEMSAKFGVGTCNHSIKEGEVVKTMG